MPLRTLEIKSIKLGANKTQLPNMLVFARFYVLQSSPFLYPINLYDFFVVVVLFNIPPTAKVIWRQGHGLKSHLKDG